MRAVTFVLGALCGAVIAYLADPDLGRTRRSKLRDQSAGTARQLKRRGVRMGRRVSSDAAGAVQRLARQRTGVQVAATLSDAELKDKVESEALGAAWVPKGRINVDVVARVVTLRGQLDSPEEIDRIGRVVAAISGVGGVENLLHTPDTPASNKAIAREAG